MRANTEKAAIEYIEQQNKERMSQGYKAMTPGEEDMVYNAFLMGYREAAHEAVVILIEEL